MSRARKASALMARKGPRSLHGGAPDAADEAAGEPVPEALLRRERAGAALAAHARAHDEIDLPRCDRVGERRHLLGLVAVVAVEEHDDVGRVQRLYAGLAGRSVAALAFVHHAGAGALRSPRRAVVRAVVDDDDLVDPAGNVGDDAADRLLLVEGGDDDADLFAVSHQCLARRLA